MQLSALLADRVPPRDPARPPRPPLPLAVLTMELQRGVIGDLSPRPELAQAVATAGVIEHTARLLEHARRTGIPVVHCTAGFRPDWAGSALNTPLFVGAHRAAGQMTEGTAQTELVAELGPAPSDLVSPRRHGVSPFIGTDLDATLRNLGVATVVATGVSVNVGITGLCVEAANLGYRVVVATDAVTGTPADYVESALRNSLAVIATLATVEEIIAGIDQALAEAGARTPPGSPEAGGYQQRS